MAKIKHILLYILAAVFLCVTNISFYAQDTGWNYDDKALERVKEPKYQGYKSLPKKARKHFEGMKFIPGGTFTMGRSAQETTFCDKDSTLLVGNILTRVSQSSFFISDHEVTNAEYREFTNWVKVRVAMDILAEHYPEKRLPNGQYNQEIPIDWRDIVLDSLLYYPQNRSYYRRKEIDTRKLIYTYQYEELNDSLYRINFSDTITNDSSLLWDRNISACMELKEVSIAVYPDTLCWVNDFSYSYNEPMTKMYFWHPAYDNYPVVGVSWLQAAAYCLWRTDRLNEDILIAEKVLKKRSYYFSTDELLQDSSNRYYMQILYPNFRFPTEAEWEYAATYIPEGDNVRIYQIGIYPWEGYTTTNKKGEYLANFGTILDQNNVQHKSFDDDGFFHTSEVKHYPPNQKGLYDMAGNVAEWVLNKYEVMDHTYRVLPNDDAQTAFEKVYKQMEYGFEIRDSLNELDRWYLTRYAEQAMHNAKVLDKMQPARGVKGGSWADPAVYIMPGTRTIYNENKTSSRIGFRVAMSLGNLYDQRVLTKRFLKIDTLGVDTLLPDNFNKIKLIKEDLYYILENGKYGIVNKYGQTIISIIYDYIVDYVDKGLAIVYIGKTDLFNLPKGGKFGVVDSTGREIVPVIFDFAMFSEDRERVIVKKDGKFGCYDLNGNILIEPCYSILMPFTKNGFALVSHNFKWGVISNLFEETIHLVYDDLRFASDDTILLAKLNDKWGMLDINNSIIASFQYDFIGCFYNGVAVCRIGDKWGYISLSGNSICDNIYDYVYSFSDNHGIVLLDGKFGYINIDGELITSINYDNALNYYKGVAIVERSGKYALLDSEGNNMTGFEYDECSNIGDVFKVKSNEKWGIINNLGKVVLNIKYNEISKFSAEGIALVTLIVDNDNNSYFYIDYNATQLFDETFVYASEFVDGVAIVKQTNKSDACKIDITGNRID